ncbi:MAG: deoxyribonuclease IV [Gemmatimonadales bacterium]|nr:deoxyribonuclease IV [Gemmatimonadales bacterium]
MRTSSGTRPRREKTIVDPGKNAERLGAHVSTQGGCPTAPRRGFAIGATAIQLFTKTPNMWREPEVTPAIADDFRRARDVHPVGFAVSHDSYLINLASPDPALRARSIAAFIGELTRSEALGLDGIVSHPGNFIDDHDAGLERNATAITEALRAAPGSVPVLLETTAGSGTVLGRSFEELAAIRNLVADDVRHRVRFCADTCHLYSAGYDLVTEFETVWDTWDRVIGIDLLTCLHMNDSKTPFASRRDRHALIGEGSLGTEPFRQIMVSPRLAGIPKILETPKGDLDEVTNDLAMLALLRAMGGAN